MNGLQVPEVHLITTETEVPAGTMITCPNCNYTGFGFMYVENIERVSPVTGNRAVRLDLADNRFDPDEDRLECPGCQHRFPVPGGIVLSFELGDD